METLAIQQAENPVNIVTQTLHLPDWAPSTIHLPAKLMWGNNMLGLGDIALPGLLISYVYRYEQYLGRNSYSNMKIFPGVMAGYSVGLVVTEVFLIFFRVSQPALLYLVPCSLLPTIMLSYMNNELPAIWNGNNMDLGDAYAYANVIQYKNTQV